MKTINHLSKSLLLLMAFIPSTLWAQEALPFTPTPSGSTANRSIQESVYSPIADEKHLPEDAPNIIIILIDDVGPGQSSTFGGEIATPTMDRLADEGGKSRPVYKTGIF